MRPKSEASEGSIVVCSFDWCRGPRVAWPDFMKLSNLPGPRLTRSSAESLPERRSAPGEGLHSLTTRVSAGEAIEGVPEI